MRQYKRKSIWPLVATSVVLVGWALVCGRAEALPSSLSAGARAAFDTTNPVEQAACWRFAWHGWGWYPYCGPLRPPVVYEDVYDAWRPACRDITEREREGSRVVVRHIRRCD